MQKQEICAIQYLPKAGDLEMNPGNKVEEQRFMFVDRNILRSSFRSFSIKLRRTSSAPKTNRIRYLINLSRQNFDLYQTLWLIEIRIKKLTKSIILQAMK